MQIIEAPDWRRGAAIRQVVESPNWEQLDPPPYQCRVVLVPEAEGGYSAHALRLPGVVSQGETREEAMENVVDAFRGAIAEYLNDAGRIPWSDVEISRTDKCVERWILVNV